MALRLDLDALKIRFAFLREPQRVATVVITVALGVLAMIVADGFIERTLFQFRESLIRSEYSHLQVLPSEDDASLPAGGSSPLRDRVSRALAGDPGARVVSRFGFSGLLSRDDRSVGFLGEGVEPASEREVSSSVVMMAGQPLTEGDERVLLGQGLAYSVGAKVGDSVVLLASLPDGGINAVELEVGGIFHTYAKAYDDRALRVPIETARRLMRSDGASRLMILLSETAQTDLYAGRLRHALEGLPVRVSTWTDLADFYNKTATLFRRQLGVVRTIVLAIVLLAVSNALVRNVLEQRREIGTRMALGARRRSVALACVGEAAMLGAVGGLIGAALAAVVAVVVTRVGIPMPPPPGMAHGFVTGVQWSPASAAFALAAVVIACVGAAIPPALRAAGMSIVDALRTDR